MVWCLITSYVLASLHNLLRILWVNGLIFKQNEKDYLTLANFQSIKKEILSRVFSSQCCHMYGSQAWALDACHIKSFCSTWRKAIRKLLGLPNIARSALVPHLVNAPPIEDQLYQRTAKMYNGIRKGHNPNLLLLLQLSTNTDKMGIMGNNTRIISNRWLCGFNRLERNFVER